MATASRCVLSTAGQRLKEPARDLIGPPNIQPSQKPRASCPTRSSTARYAPLTKTARRISRRFKPLFRRQDRLARLFAFDLLFEGGVDLRTRPLTERKERLQQLLSKAGADARIRFVEHFEDGGEAVLRSACRLSLEGIVSKRGDASSVLRRAGFRR